MFAVVKVGSSQHKVAEGDVINVSRLDVEKGKSVTLDNVLLYSKGSDVRVGQPFLKDVKIKAKVVDQVSDKKVIAFKYRRRKDSSSIKGHRQKLTSLNITQISASEK